MVCAHVYADAHRGWKKGFDPSDTRGKGSCILSDMGTGDQIQVLQERHVLLPANPSLQSHPLSIFLSLENVLDEIFTTPYGNIAD